MPSSIWIHSPRATARAAGLFYLVIIICGIGAQALLRGPLVVPGDPVATTENIAGAELRFRLSILADVVMALSDVALAILLYALLRPVHHLLALLATAFRLVQAAILGINVLHLWEAAALAVGPSSSPMRDELVHAGVEAHAAGYDFALFFFGVNCVLVAILLLRSMAVPRVLAALISAAGLVYLAGATTRVVAPELVDWVAPAYLIPVVAELGFCVWLIVKGLEDRRPASR